MNESNRCLKPKGHATKRVNWLHQNVEGMLLHVLGDMGMR